MLKHRVFNIKWIGFPENNTRRVKGCYMIGDIYIGASVHIRARILSHCATVCNCTKKEFKTYSRGTCNYDVYSYILGCMVRNEPIEVKLLSNNPYDKKDLIRLYDTRQSQIHTYDTRY